MKNDVLLKIFFFTLALSFAQPLPAQNKIFFSNIPKNIKCGTEFNITCRFLNTQPAGVTIKTWDWHIIAWHDDYIDTLTSFHSDQHGDSCVWIGTIDGTGFASITGRFPERAYIVVRAVDSDNNFFYRAQCVSLSMPSYNCGCLYDMLDTHPIPFMITPHQKFTCQSHFYDDDYNGTVAKYWSWEIAMISADGFQIMAAADSIEAPNEYSFSITLDSIDVSKNWIYSDSGTISGLLGVHVIASDGTSFFTSHDFQYGNHPTSVRIHESTPGSMWLHQNYPNPFNPSTTIQFALPDGGDVQLTIYDLLGKEIAVLVNQKLAVGHHTIKWDASAFSTGVYLYRLQAGTFVQTRKLILIK